MGLIRVVFEVTCQTSIGDEVRLVGSLPEFGAWDPKYAVPLKTSEQLYPIWQSAELLLPGESELQYKYLRLPALGSAQWEAGPCRVLDSSLLSESMVNCVGDIMFDADESSQRRNSGFRIRFQTSRSQIMSVGTSRLASSIPSPLRTAGPTPVENSCSISELEHILSELRQLETLPLASRSDVRRAVASVSRAIEAERSKGRLRQKSRSHCCSLLAVLLVPLLPFFVATAIVWRVPSARHRRDELWGIASGHLQRMKLPPEWMRSWV